MKLNTLVAALIATVAVPVFAQTTTPNIDKREANQQQRIEQGVQSGQLTNREAARLEKGEAHIDKMEAKAKADGKVTPQERKRIEHAQNVESRKIYREKHDRQHDLNHDGKMDRPHRGEKH
jgi:uncharacterized membrane protein YebE (DUF533 family)